jgi:hypothetical protein
MTNLSKKNQPLGVDAIAHIAKLYNERRLSDALQLIESTFNLTDESALILFAVVREVV